MTTRKLTNFGNPSNGDWRSKRAEIKAARQQYSQDFGLMSQYERVLFEREIEQKKTQYDGEIVGGVLAEWNSAVENVKRALDGVTKAKQQERANWDGQRLAGELTVYRELIQRALVGDGRIDNETLANVQRVYQEAVTSGDKYKSRAAAEIMRGVVGMAPNNADLEIKTRLNRFGKEATRELETLQHTPTIQAAHDAAARAVDALNRAKQEMIATAEDIGSVYPNGELREFRLVKALSSVQQDPDGNFVFGELE